jgi:hypothetical protein
MRLIRGGLPSTEPDATREPSRARNPFRCFNVRYLARTAGVASLIVLLAYVGKSLVRGSPPRLALGGVQALLVAWIIVDSVARIRTLDEFLQRIHLEAIAISFAVTGAAMTAWGMLVHAGAPPVEWSVWAWPVMTLLWGVIAAIRARQFR